MEYVHIMNLLLGLALVASTTTAQEFQFSDDLLFVVGGIPSQGSVEVIDLSNETLSCPTPEDIPIGYGSVATFIDSSVMVCGGYGSSGVVNECYNYNPSADTWTETHSMLSVRYMAAAVQLSPTRWWITGGLGSGSGYLSSTELFTVGEGFSEFVDMPTSRGYHNLVKVNDSHVILLGGGSTTSNAWMFDVAAETWSPLPDLLSGIIFGHAGLVTTTEGTRELVVGPDRNSARTQVLDLDTLTWRYGSDFPGGDVWTGASVPYGDTFLVVGGVGDVGGYHDTIYKYEVEDDGHSWSLLPQRLSTARRFLAALMVPNNYVACEKEANK